MVLAKVVEDLAAGLTWWQARVRVRARALQMSDLEQARVRVRAPVLRVCALAGAAAAARVRCSLGCGYLVPRLPEVRGRLA